jgi:alpha-tubulin suppressor-like RCC1 family protein
MRGKKIKMIAAGSEHSFALTSAGALYVWGGSYVVSVFMGWFVTYPLCTEFSQGKNVCGCGNDAVVPTPTLLPAFKNLQVIQVPIPITPSRKTEIQLPILTSENSTPKINFEQL